MRKTRKIVSLILALVMAMAMTTTAFAADTGTSATTKGKITLNNAVSGTTYNAYKILELESYNKTANTYTYKVGSAMKAFFANYKVGDANAFTVDTQDYVTLTAEGEAMTDAQKAELAKAALAAAKTAGIAPSAKTASSTTVVWEELDLGYYVIDSNMGTLCTLDTTNNEITVDEKNELPTITKLVQEGTDWVAENDANIGDTVNFKITVNAKEGAAGYVLTDTLSAGLALQADTIVVKKGDTPLTENTDYTVDTATAQTFTVKFTEACMNALTDTDVITVEYSATLDEDAVVAGTGNDNTAVLKYGDNSEFTTTEAKTVTKTWEFDVNKYAEGNANLAGATFELHKDTETGALVNFVETANDTYSVCTLTGCTHTHVTSITSSAAADFALNGLDSGTYYLVETEAPQGYNKLADAVKVVIAAEGSVTKDDVAVGDKIIGVENKTGSLLPSTGGIGTTIFYIGGSILVVAALVLLVTKRRMSVNE